VIAPDVEKDETNKLKTKCIHHQNLDRKTSKLTRFDRYGKKDERIKVEFNQEKRRTG
jgi:hypothetical protein